MRPEQNQQSELTSTADGEPSIKHKQKDCQSVCDQGSNVHQQEASQALTCRTQDTQDKGYNRQRQSDKTRIVLTGTDLAQFEARQEWRLGNKDAYGVQESVYEAMSDIILDHIDKDGSVEGWRIGYLQKRSRQNKSRYDARQAKYFDREISSDDPSIANIEGASTAGIFRNPLEIVLANEEIRELGKALRRLKRSEREIINLYDIEGMTFVEMSAMFLLRNLPRDHPRYQPISVQGIRLKRKRVLDRLRELLTH